MKRFTAEISLGLATAAMILIVCAWARVQAPAPHLQFVLYLSMAVWFRSRRASTRQPPAQQVLAPASREEDEEVRSLLLRGEGILAIKRHRDLHGSTLREAVDHVKALRRDMIQN